MAKINETNIYEKGTFLFLRSHNWGGKGKINPNDAGVDKDKEDVIHTVQELILKDDITLMKQIKKSGKDLKKTVKKLSIPFGKIDSVYFVKFRDVDFIENSILKANKERDELVEELTENFQKIKKRFKKKHPDIFNESKYPSISELKNRFSIEYSWKRLMPPENTPSETANKLFEKEWMKFKDEIEEMKNATLSMVSNQIIKKLTVLQKQCVDEKVNAKTINTINKFLDNFDDIFKDFIDNKKLKDTVKEIKSFMKTDIGTWKGSEDFQNKMEKQIGKVIKKVTRINNPRRAIEL